MAHKNNFNKPTPANFTQRSPMQNLAVAQLLNSLPNYETRRFMTMFTVPHTRSCPKQDQFRPHSHTLYTFKIQSTVMLPSQPIYLTASWLDLSKLNFCTHLSSLVCGKHAQSISYNLCEIPLITCVKV